MVEVMVELPEVSTVTRAEVVIAVEEPPEPPAPPAPPVTVSVEVPVGLVVVVVRVEPPEPDPPAPPAVAEAQ